MGIHIVDKLLLTGAIVILLKMERASNWAELTAPKTVEAQTEVECAQIDRLLKEREMRAKTIECMGNAIKCVEAMITSSTASVDNFNMSDVFVTRIKAALSTFERTIPDKFTLNDTSPPNSIQVTIRMREDLGTIVTETGQLVLNKNSIICGNRNELIHLVRSGHADLLH